MNDLIGKKFRRNKYGLSLWEDEIEKVYYDISWIVKSNIRNMYLNGAKVDEVIKKVRENNTHGFKAIPMVKGKSTITPFELDEIIIYL